MMCCKRGQPTGKEVEGERLFSSVRLSLGIDSFFESGSRTTLPAHSVDHHRVDDANTDDRGSSIFRPTERIIQWRPLLQFTPFMQTRRLFFTAWSRTTGSPTWLYLVLTVIPRFLYAAKFPFLKQFFQTSPETNATGDTLRKPQKSNSAWVISMDSNTVKHWGRESFLMLVLTNSLCYVGKKFLF